MGKRDAKRAAHAKFFKELKRKEKRQKKSLKRPSLAPAINMTIRPEAHASLVYADLER